MISTVKSRQRIIDHGEVFTPSALVNDMLDLVAHECERIDSRFLEPACGDGNFLAEVLRRKLLTVDKKNARNPDKWERDAILAVCSLYGIARGKRDRSNFIIGPVPFSAPIIGPAPFSAPFCSIADDLGKSKGRSDNSILLARTFGI